MVIVPRTVASHRRERFAAVRRAMFDRCKDEFAEMVANGVPLKTAARLVDLPSGLARDLLRQLHYEVWGSHEIR